MSFSPGKTDGTPYGTPGAMQGPEDGIQIGPGSVPGSTDSLGGRTRQSMFGTKPQAQQG